MEVKCDIEKVEMEGMFGAVDGIRATCSRCGHVTESFGTTDRSVRRCCVLMREQCPRSESNFYYAEGDGRENGRENGREREEPAARKKTQINVPDPRIIILRRKNSTPEEVEFSQSAVDSLEGKVYGDWQLDWDKLRESTGSYQGAYEWCAQTFDVFVVIPMRTPDGSFVARGQYSIVSAALALGKEVMIPDGTLVARVDPIEPNTRQADWKGAFARVYFVVPWVDEPQEPRWQEPRQQEPEPKKQQRQASTSVLEVRRLFRLNERGE
jgi:hypothetical protein